VTLTLGAEARVMLLTQIGGIPLVPRHP